MGQIGSDFTCKGCSVNDTHREKIYSAQKFGKIKSWLLLIFSICLHNQLNSTELEL